MKKLRLILSIVLLLALGLTTFQANAQRRRGGTPPSFLLKGTQALLNAKAYAKMPVNFTISELLMEDEHNADKLIPMRIARDIPANLTMENSGVWSELPNGQRIWQLAVEAKGAKALIISYEKFYLPAGSQLFVYNAEKTTILGAFNNTDNVSGGRYSTPFVWGDVAILEYVAPAKPGLDKPIINIEAVGYGYNHLYAKPNPNYTDPDAGNECQVNVICSPEGDLWTTQKKSVCQLSMRFDAGWGGCTGTLINNTRNDGTPYIITADHCILDYNAAYFPQWQFNFLYESDDCATNSNVYDNLVSLVGLKAIAEDVSINGGSDGALLLMADNAMVQLADLVVKGEVTYAGWRRQPPTTTTSGVGIHHPKTAPKKILTYSGLKISTWSGSGYVGATGVHLTAGGDAGPSKTPNGWSQTEQGSSGSGLFDQDGYLIGTLTGGSAASCTGSSPGSSMYGGLWYHWDHGINGGMGNFLDPVGGGTADVCEPWPITTPSDFSGFPRNLYALQSVLFVAMVAGADSLLWEFEGGTPATSTDKSPRVIYNTDGVYSVKLTIYRTDAGGNVEETVIEKLDYITVTIKCGSQAHEPKANFIAYNFSVQDPIYKDNGMTATGLGVNATPPTILRNGATNSATATYWRESAGGANVTNANLDNTGTSSPNLWVRRNNAVASSGPVSSGYGGTGDYYYAFYSTTANHKARMYNREPFDLSGVGTVGDSVVLKFKMYRRYANLTAVLVILPIGIVATVADGFEIQYRSAPTDKWTTIYTQNQKLQPVDADNNPVPIQGCNEWLDYTVKLPNLSSTYQIAFVGLGVNHGLPSTVNGLPISYTMPGKGLALDNIEIIEYAGEVAEHVTIWEGDRVKFFDHSEGCPVHYEYNYEKGTPDKTTTIAPYMFEQYNVANVTNMANYNSANDYSASQWVQNTFGEDSFTLQNYVTVMGRTIYTDKDEVRAECNYVTIDTVIVTSNKNWVVGNKPAWVTVTPVSGTVAEPGTCEDFKVEIKTAENTSHEARLGAVLFTTDDGIARTALTVKQATPAPNVVTVETDPDSNNALITWNRLRGMPVSIIESKLITESKLVTESTPIQKALPFNELTANSRMLPKFELVKGNEKNNGGMKLQNQLQSDMLTQSLNVSDLTEITWSSWQRDGGIQAGGTGFRVAHMWTVPEITPYKGYEIKGIRMASASSTTDYTIFIIEGKTELYSKHIGKLPITPGTVLDTVFELDYPVIISATANLYVGYGFEDGYTDSPTCKDNINTQTSPTHGKGNLISLDGAPWEPVRDLSSSGPLLGNWMLSAYLEKPMPPGFNVYRQRFFLGEPTEEPQRIAAGLTDTTYLDEDIRPGGEYCYHVTYTHLNMESCPGDTGCIFITYSQNIAGNFSKGYGDPRPFTVYNYVHSSADTIDYFVGQGTKWPVKLEYSSGDAGVLTLSGAPGNYSAYINKAGTVVFMATQEGSPGILLPADTAYITASVRKHNLYVIAVDEQRPEGMPNALVLKYDNFVYGEKANVLDRQPDVITSANEFSPIGDYRILVTVYPDKNYNTIAVDGMLTVIKRDVKDKINAFTPYEEDGVNDRFMAGYKIKVFNRYGVLVYETENVTQKLLGWDGRLKKSNKLAAPGVYYYVAYDDDGKVVSTGSVTVLKD